jgi:hypothetical protein
MTEVRLVLLLDEPVLCAWEARAVERCLEVPGVRLVGVVTPAVPPRRERWLRRLWARRRTLGYSAFDRLDRLLFDAERDPFEGTDSSHLLGGIPIVEVIPRRTRFTDWVDDGLEPVEHLRATVMVRFGFRILRGAILDLAPAGVWSFHHGDNRVNRGGPPGFWEVNKGWPTTGAVLQVLTDDLDAGLVIDRCWSKTDPLSPTRNRGRYYWRALGMLPRAVEELVRFGPAEFKNVVRLRQDLGRPYSHPLFRAPGNFRAAGATLGLIRKGVGRRLRARLRPEQWVLGWRIGPDVALDLKDFQVLQPPEGTWWADPAVVADADGWWIFHEDMKVGSPGRVSVQRLLRSGEFDGPQEVLERPYHLSYPFVFKVGTEWFMTPETAAAGRMEVYGAVDFPHRWELAGVAFEGESVLDPTPFHHDGLWYLFAGWQEEEGAPTTDQLRIFISDDPVSGCWEPHPANPVMNHPRGARPGGALFWEQDRLVRPAQDCSGWYGRGLILKHVRELSPDTFEEVEAGGLWPDFDPHFRGCHSLASDDGLTVVDFLRT